MIKNRKKPYLLFEFSDEKGNVKPVCFTNPVEIITANTVNEVIPALKQIQYAVDQGLYAAGYLSYEAAAAFDQAFSVHSEAKMPLLWFGLFDQATNVELPESRGDFNLSSWKSSTDLQTYASKFSRIKKAIQEGETYQVNYSIRLQSGFQGSDFPFYRQLMEAQCSNYGAYLDLGRFRILSASPELFFHWDGNRITTRPMKGTATRGRWAEEDNAQASQLYQSEKNRAENLMIVDLLRNDMGIIAKVGSVEVTRLFEIEKYPTVLQMTSTIEAETKHGTKLEDVLRALFPCGSVTGAPKISTMELISCLESSPREVYCGAIGFMKPTGESIFNVAIRSVIIDSLTGTAEYGTGGGIVADSTVDGEYEEAFIKADLLMENRPQFKLLESLKLMDGEYKLLERHLQRLEQTAQYFDFHISIDKIKTELKNYAQKYPASVYKVRLLTSKEGKVVIDGQPTSALKEPLPVEIARNPVPKSDVFLYHKTTHRKVYKDARASHPDAFDVLLWNEEGELTEFTIGNLVLEIEGQCWTPPRESGLLNGTFREELLEKGQLKERVLTIENLNSCTRLWLINSIRGWVSVYVRSKDK